MRWFQASPVSLCVCVIYLKHRVKLIAKVFLNCLATFLLMINAKKQLISFKSVIIFLFVFLSYVFCVSSYLCLSFCLFYCGELVGNYRVRWPLAFGSLCQAPEERSGSGCCGPAFSHSKVQRDSARGSVGYREKYRFLTGVCGRLRHFYKSVVWRSRLFQTNRGKSQQRYRWNCSDLQKWPTVLYFGSEV